MPNHRQKHTLSNVQIFNFVTILPSWQLPVKHDVPQNTVPQTLVQQPLPHMWTPSPPSACRSSDTLILRFSAVILMIIHGCLVHHSH